MLRFCTILLISTVAFAQPAKTDPKSKPEAKPAEQPKAPAVPAVPLTEMEALRAILDRKLATYQDLADIVLIRNGTYESIKSAADRRGKVEELKIYNFADVADPETTPLQRGAVAKVILSQFKLQHGFWFRFTKWERYAMHDVKRVGLMDHEYSRWSYLTGEQLISVFDRAGNVEEYIANWPPGSKSFVDAMDKAEKPTEEKKEPTRKGKK